MPQLDEFSMWPFRGLGEEKPSKGEDAGRGCRLFRHEGSGQQPELQKNTIEEQKHKNSKMKVPNSEII